jgi:hypothetical protein
VEARIVEKCSEVGAVDKLHGEEERVVFGAFQVAAVYDILVAHVAQRPHLAQEAAGEGLVAAQFGREEFEGAGLVHEDALGEIDRAHAALAEFADDAITVVDDHARLEVANFIEQNAVGGAGGERVGVAGVAVRAGLQGFASAFSLRRDRTYCRAGLAWGAEARRGPVPR